MTGHAVLSSCHNCGATDQILEVVDVTKDGECGHQAHHVHVTVACPSCRKSIWKQ